MRRGWHLIPLGLILLLLITLPVAAFTDTGLEEELRGGLGLDTGQCEPSVDYGSAWVEAATFPEVLDEPRGTTIGGEVYLAGGLYGIKDEDGVRKFTSSDDLTGFDVETERYERLARMPEPKNHIGIVSHDGKVYVVGGYGGSLEQSTATFHVYDPATDSWSRLPDLPAPRAATAVGVIGDLLVVAGGAIDTKPRSQVFAFDLRTEKWSRLPEMGSRREHVGSAVIGDRLYVLGGRTESSQAVDTVEAFDLSERRWMQLPPLPVPVGGLGAVSAGGKVIAIGGGNDAAGTVTNSVQAYDPGEEEWRQLSPMRIPRHGQAVAAAGGRIWSFAGSPCAYFNASDSTESLEFDPS
jgi:N-acetylneuraminic acid mutarotase